MDTLCPRRPSEVASHAAEIERCLWGSRMRRDDSFSMPDDHIHSCYELFYLAQGHCRVFVDDAFYTLSPGCGLLLPPGILHHMVYASGQESLRYSFYFCAPLLEDLRQCGASHLASLTAGPVQLGEATRTEVQRLLELLLQEQQGIDEYSLLLCRHTLNLILVLLMRQCCPVPSRTAPPAPRRSGGWQEAMVQDTIHYLMEHFAEPISLDELAARVPASPTYFSKCFKKATGLGYREYLIYIRIREAKRLLTETDLPVHEIARRCGYTSSNYFGDVFSAVVGSSPRQYRAGH